MIPDAEDGHYWLLWEPAPGWDPPADNPVRYSRGEDPGQGIEGWYRQIPEGMGTLHIEAGEPGKGESWNLKGPDGFFAAGKGSRTFPGRSVGDYRLLWESDSAEASDSEEFDRLEADGELVLRTGVEELSAETGSIAIEPKPRWLDAPWVLESAGGLRLALIPAIARQSNFSAGSASFDPSW